MNMYWLQDDAVFLTLSTVSTIVAFSEIISDTYRTGILMWQFIVQLLHGVVTWLHVQLT